MTQSTETPEWVDDMLGQLADGTRSFRMDPVGIPERTPLVESGPVRVQWVRKGKDLLYHLYLVEGFEWPPEEEMRELLGGLFEELIGSTSEAKAAYTEELDSWGIKLSGFGQRTGKTFEHLTLRFLELLVEKLEAR